MTTFKNVYIPYGGYWSTPFARWQGSLSTYNAVELAAQVAKEVLAARNIAPESFDSVALGLTVPQKSSFYGAPWLAAMIGAPGVTGPTIAQACATSARVIASSAQEIELGARQCVLGVTCDRTSNGPHIYYPNPTGVGGRGETEEWVWDNFNRDPHAHVAMIQTAENVAKEASISREAQDELTLLRHTQYQNGLANERAFQKKYMAGVSIKKGKTVTAFDADEGIFPTTADGLAKLKPVQEGGSVTFGTQTFPADGNAGIVITNRQRAEKLTRDNAITIQLLSYGEARTKKAHMAMAVVPAAQQAAERAGIKIADCKAFTTHNPFAVNDVYFCQQTGVKAEQMNRYGSSLIWGHPQGPTGTRALIELIEDLAQQGGGYGLFAGCAAGDTAMALIIKVN